MYACKEHIVADIKEKYIGGLTVPEAESVQVVEYLRGYHCTSC